LIESFTQIESDVDLGDAENFAYTKDISDLPDYADPAGYLPIRVYERKYATNPPVSPFTKIVFTEPYAGVFASVGDFLAFYQFSMTIGVFAVDDLWGTPNRYAGQLALIGDFTEGLGCYLALRSKVRFVPSDSSWGVRAWVIPHIFWTCEFTFAYDSGLFKMVLSATAEFKGFVAMTQGVWFDMLGVLQFGDFSSNNRMRILIIGETPEAWQSRTGIILTDYP